MIAACKATRADNQVEGPLRAKVRIIASIEQHSHVNAVHSVQCVCSAVKLGEHGIPGGWARHACTVDMHK